MADLSIDFAGIKAPTILLARSLLPIQDIVMKAYDAGWGGAVWKTLECPP